MILKDILKVKKQSGSNTDFKKSPMSKGKTPHFVWDFPSTEQFSPKRNGGK